MNEEIEPILIGGVEDIDPDSVEHFEHEEVDYAIYRLDSGFYATQGTCVCEEGALLSEGTIEKEEIDMGEEYWIGKVTEWLRIGLREENEVFFFKERELRYKERDRKEAKEKSNNNRFEVDMEDRESSIRRKTREEGTQWYRYLDILIRDWQNARCPPKRSGFAKHGREA